MSTKNINLEVDVYWSMDCHFCYVALNRCLEMQSKYNLNLNLHVVYPNVLTDPDALAAMDKLHYLLPYMEIDGYRNGYFRRVPIRQPVPDILVVHPNKDKDGLASVAPLEEQIYLHFLVRTAVAATEMGKGWEYLNQVMRLLWNGQKKPWDKDDFSHVISAINASEIDAKKLLAAVNADPKKYDDIAAASFAKQITNDCKHAGVPCFVFNNEPFFGQDRINHVIWRMEQYGLTEREDYVPSTRARGNPDFWG